MSSFAHPVLASSSSSSSSGSRHSSSVLIAPWATTTASTTNSTPTKTSPHPSPPASPAKQRKATREGNPPAGTAAAATNPSHKQHKHAPAPLSPGKMAAAATGAGNRQKPPPKVVHIVGAAGDGPKQGVKRRVIIDYRSPCKRIKTLVAEVVYPHGQATQPPPPARELEPPLVLGIVPVGSSSSNSNSSSSSSSNAKAAKAMKAIDTQVKVSSSVAGMVVCPSTSITTTINTTSTSTCTFSLRSSGAVLPTDPSSTGPGKRKSPPQQQQQQQQQQQFQPQEQVPIVLSEEMQQAAARLSTLLLSKNLPGMAELLSYVSHAQVQCQEHSTLFTQAMDALKNESALRKEVCDFEQVFNCAGLAYGQRPSAVFADLIDPKFPVVETYHEHAFLRLFMHFVVTRLQMLRGLVVEEGGKEGGREEEVAVVDVYLKMWWRRARMYV